MLSKQLALALVLLASDVSEALISPQNTIGKKQRPRMMGATRAEGLGPMAGDVDMPAALEDIAGRLAKRRTAPTAQEVLHEGLTKVHQNILEATLGRQRFITGKDPLVITVTENPTKKWLQRNAATTQLLVNGTTIANSYASGDRLEWFETDERTQNSITSIDLVGEINLKRPAYVNIMSSNAAGSSAAIQRTASASKGWHRWKTSPVYEKLVLEELEQQEADRISERLWVTGFSLTSKEGLVHSVDVETGEIESVNSRTSASIQWPNECVSIPASLVKESAGEMDDALLVSDGFLVPGKNNGGLYVVKNPGDKDLEWTVCLTGGLQTKRAKDFGWFYHRSVWVDLTGDGRKSILTARAKLNGASNRGKARTQLVWLEMPSPDRIDLATGTPLEPDGTVFDPFNVRHLPWKTHVLDEGPDVMFAIADLDTNDDTIEVIASRFFDRTVSLHSIQIGAEPKVVFDRVIDEDCGAAFSCILANLDPLSVNPNRQVVDSGSTVETLQRGDSFSHLLVTSHECSYSDGSEDSNISGGSLFSYGVPDGDWRTDPWLRTTISSDFTVEGQLGNMINPGAPGFVYTFHAHKDATNQRPLIAVAGDCASSAFIYRPSNNSDAFDLNAQYKLMCEIECGATVGSVGIGYENLMSEYQEDGYAKLYVPMFEKDKILVFALGSGEDEGDDGW